MAPRLGPGLQWLHDAGVLGIVLPELDATVDFSQEAGRRHKDVWEHTKQVVVQSPLKTIVRWSALLHDIGKVPTRVLLPDGRVTFHRHAEVGARMFDSIARRLQFDRETRQRIRFLIYHHLRANAYQAAWTDSAVRRFDLRDGSVPRRAGRAIPGRRDLAPSRTAPGGGPEHRGAGPSHPRRAGAGRQGAPLPPGLGNAFMEAFALGAGRRIGELRKMCEDAIERGDLEERRDADYYVTFLRGRGVTG